jgi:hypothetical protein
MGTQRASHRRSLLELPRRIRRSADDRTRGRCHAWLGGPRSSGRARPPRFSRCFVLGPAVQRVELKSFQLAVGILLLLFGMRWARKAILRSAGVLGLHDEAEAFSKEERALASITRGSATIDWAGFSTAFQGVVVEGVEVVFIVIAIGTGRITISAPGVCAQGPRYSGKIRRVIGE